MLIPFNYLFNKYKIKPKGVLHVGGSLGQEASAYHNYGISKALFIEAIPDVFKKLEVNLMNYLNYEAINACITDVDGQEIEFNISSNDGQSSSIYDFGTHALCHPDVTFVSKIQLKTKRLDTLINELGIDFAEGFDFINFDIQGAELLALKSMGDYLHSIKAAYLEVNKQHTYEGCALVEEVDEYMAKFGFERVETTAWIGDTWADAFYLKSNK